MTDQPTDPTPGAPEADADPPEDADTFPRSYVERLRAEAADRRTAARDAEARAEALTRRLLTAEVARAVDGVLADGDDLTAHVPAAELVGEDGLPDAERIRAAAEALAERKPHLAARRFGEADLGVRRQAPSFDLAAVLRDAAG
ncbi:MAG TPA: hypothetical protein VGB14_12905 [Acidimicrobiales bacterium]